MNNSAHEESTSRIEISSDFIRCYDKNGNLTHEVNLVPPGVFPERDLIETDVYCEREGQPCWCPDAFRDAGFHVIYCPQHGSQPDYSLTDL